MASLADTAAEYGVTSPDPNEDILKPVSLSPSTRRQIGVLDRRQAGVNTFSDAAQLEDSIIAKREAEDKAIDDAWNRDMTRRENAVKWNNKVLTQQHGDAAMDGLMQLRPDDPEYQAKVTGLIAQHPLAPADTRIANILKANDAAFTLAEAAREEARKHADALEKSRIDREAVIESRIANREDRQASDKEQQRLAAEYRIEENLPKLSKPARDIYLTKVKEGSDKRDAYLEALAAHQDDDDKKNLAILKAGDSNIRGQLEALKSSYGAEAEAQKAKLMQDQKDIQTAIAKLLPAGGEAPKPDDSKAPAPAAAVKPEPVTASTPIIKTVSEYNDLKSGTTYIDPNGKKRVKP